MGITFAISSIGHDQTKFNSRRSFQLHREESHLHPLITPQPVNWGLKLTSLLTINTVDTINMVDTKVDHLTHILSTPDKHYFINKCPHRS